MFVEPVHETDANKRIGYGRYNGAAFIEAFLAQPLCFEYLLAFDKRLGVEQKVIDKPPALGESIKTVPEFLK
jgi:hypothetical protein